MKELGAMKHIGIICGSLRKDSYNRIIGENLAKMDDTVSFSFIPIGNLPLFNEDLEKDGDPQAVQQLKEAIQHVDGLIIVSPEYNASVPGVLKNAIDWASRSGNNKTSVLHDKPVGIIGATPGGMGTAFAQLHLRQILEKLHVRVLPFEKLLISQVDQKVDSDTRKITDEKIMEQLKKYLQHFIEWMN